MRTIEHIDQKLAEVENDLLDLEIKFGLVKQQKLEKVIELLNEKLKTIENENI